MRWIGVATLAALAALGCGSNGTDASTPSTDLATSALVPWVVVDSDGTNVTVYAGLHSTTGKPVALAEDDRLSATIGQAVVSMNTFSSFSGSTFRGDTMLRDEINGLSDAIYYSATTTVATPDPIDVTVDLLRGAVHGGAANVAKVRLAPTVTITSPTPTVVPLGGKLDVCWDTTSNAGNVPAFVNELGTFGTCTYGTTIFASSSSAGLAKGCGTIDYAKVSTNDPAGCPITVWTRETSTGTYSPPFAPSGKGNGAPPYSDAPIAYQFKSFTSQLLPQSK